MKMLLDVLNNLLIIIIIFISFIDEKKTKGKGLSTIALNIILALITFSPILSKLGYGNTVIAVLNQIVCGIFVLSLILTLILDYIEFKKSLNSREYLSLVYIFIYLLCLYSLIESKREYLENIFDRIKFIHYKEMFLGLIKNNWFHGICVGIISTVVGGLILNKIITSKNKDKNKKDV